MPIPNTLPARTRCLSVRVPPAPVPPPSSVPGGCAPGSSGARGLTGRPPRRLPLRIVNMPPSWSWAPSVAIAYLCVPDLLSDPPAALGTSNLSSSWVGGGGSEGESSRLFTNVTLGAGGGGDGGTRRCRSLSLSSTNRRLESSTFSSNRFLASRSVHCTWTSSILVTRSKWSLALYISAAWTTSRRSATAVAATDASASWRMEVASLSAFSILLSEKSRVSRVIPW